jgi:hypothetical protein
VPETTTQDSLALSVHGSRGVVDLVVPRGAGVADVAAEYAAQAGLARPPVLLTATGRRLRDGGTLGGERLESGALLVATHHLPGPTPRPTSGSARDDASGTTGATPWLVAAAAVLGSAAGVLGGTAGGQTRSATVVVLLVSAVLAVLPVGRHAGQRALVTPALTGAAAFAAAYQPGAARLPLLVGIAALAAAVGAAVAKALSGGRPEAYDVWLVAGVGVFAVTGTGVLAGAEPQVAWAVLLVVALLAARFVPGFAIDVPDQLLTDLERLAVSAWSARDQGTTGTRGRTVVPAAAVAELLARGGRLVTASAAAIMVVCVVSAPALLLTATTSVDRHGALATVFLSGGGLLLAARSFRHRAARNLLRLAGLVPWVALTAIVLAGAAGDRRMFVAVGSIVMAGLVLASAIATGRGWRSVRWARRAEIGEVLCGALAVGSLVVATGLFRALWE